MVCDAVWTKERLLAVGCIFDSTCEICSLQPDTLFHWLWECVVVDEERKKVAPQHLIDEAIRFGPRPSKEFALTLRPPCRTC